MVYRAWLYQAQPGSGPDAINYKCFIQCQLFLFRFNFYFSIFSSPHVVMYWRKLCVFVNGPRYVFCWLCQTLWFEFNLKTFSEEQLYMRLHVIENKLFSVRPFGILLFRRCLFVHVLYIDSCKRFNTWTSVHMVNYLLYSWELLQYIQVSIVATIRIALAS